MVVLVFEDIDCGSERCLRVVRALSFRTVRYTSILR